MPSPFGARNSRAHEPAETGVTVTSTGVVAGVGMATVTIRLPPEAQSSVSVTATGVASIDVIFMVCENLVPICSNESAPRLATIGGRGPTAGHPQPASWAHPDSSARLTILRSKRYGRILSTASYFVANEPIVTCVGIGLAPQTDSSSCATT